MDIISNKPVFKRRVILIWSAILLSLHIIFTLLSVYDAYISGDIMQKTMDTALSVILPIVALLLIYVRFGVLVSAYHSYAEGTFPFTLTAVASLVLTRLSEIIVYKSTYTVMPVSTGAYLFSILSSFIIDLAIVILLLLFSRGEKERKRSVIRLILIACALPLAITLFDETVFLIKTLQEIKTESGSAALTADELLSVTWAFARPLVNAAIGFLIMLFTHKILKKQSFRVQ